MYNVYAVKAPLLAYNSFVEAIFILNACLLILRAHESAIEMQIYNKCVFPGAMMRIWDIKECTFMFLCWNKWLRRTFCPPLQSCAEFLAAVSDGMLDIEDIIGQYVLLANLCFVGDFLD